MALDANSHYFKHTTFAATSLPPSSNVNDIETGYAHSCVLLESGGLRCWGANDAGQIGDGSTSDRPIPVDVTGLDSAVRMVAVGDVHTCALLSSGAVKCWGSNVYGQLGDGTTTNRTTPVQVTGLDSGVTAIAAGEFHTCAIRNSGGATCWGSNANGKLGDGTTTNRTTPVHVTGLDSGVTFVSAGSQSTCAVLETGAAQCWGDNDYGQLGDGTTIDRTTPVHVTGLAGGATAVSTYLDFTCVVIEARTAQCWGSNGQGQLGDGTTTNRTTPVHVTGLDSGVTAIAVGFSHACALVDSGAVKCWGSNRTGQLGDGTTTNRTTPVHVTGLDSGVTAIAVRWGHSCAVVTRGAPKCWGFNWFGQLGDGREGGARGRPGNVQGLASGVEMITAGMEHTCALLVSESVRCWGMNQFGAVGDGSSSDVAEPTGVSGLTSGSTEVSADFHYTCALLDSGAVKCWGNNGGGQLGDGTTTNRTTPVHVTGLDSGATAITAGESHACAIDSGRSVSCWGANHVGQLGDGTTTNRTTPVHVTGLDSGVTAISAGSGHTCALLDTGAVMCWGANHHGQLGDGTTSSRTTPVHVTGLDSTAIAISAGEGQTCGLLSAGTVMCWGRNNRGQLGDGTTSSRTTPVHVTGLDSTAIAISVGMEHACAVLADGGAACWGSNNLGQLGKGDRRGEALMPTLVVDLPDAVRSISAGGSHTCSVLVTGAAICWGKGFAGQRGDGLFGFETRPVDVAGLAVASPPVFIPGTTSPQNPMTPSGPLTRPQVFRPGFDASTLRPDDIASIAPSQMRGIRAIHVRQLAPVTVAALSPELLAAIPPTAIPGFRPAQVAALTAATFGAMRPAQLSALPTRSLRSLRASQLSALTPRTFAVLRPEQIRILPPSALQGLQPSQLVVLSRAALDQLTSAQIAAIPSATISAMTARQFATLSVAQIAGFTPEQAAVLSPRQIALMPIATRERLLRIARRADVDQESP